MRNPRLLVPGVVLIIALVVAGVVFATSGDETIVDTSDVASETATVDSAVDSKPATSAATQPSTGPETTATTGTENTTTESTLPDGPSRLRMKPLITTDSGLAIGDIDAPLVMVAFESYGCLWCGQFHVRTLPQVFENYVGTGLLRIETRILPYEERAMPGARAAVAASFQDKYWELSEYMYPFITGGLEPPIGRKLDDVERGAYHERQSEAAMLAEVESVAAEIGLDYQQFVEDFYSVDTEAIIARDQQLAYSLGFTGTPALLVNGVPLGGYASYEEFDQFLQQVLADSDNG